MEHETTKGAPDRCAVITGAAGGIGKATAVALAPAGWRLVLTDMNAAALAALAGEIERTSRADCIVVEGDVTDPGLGQRLGAAVATMASPLRGLVNGAGIIDGHSLDALTDERWQYVFDVNVTSQFRVTRALLPHLRKAGGASIVNLSSVIGLRAAASMPAYCMSKAAVVGLSKSMAVDLAADGIRVNAICPGAIDTAMPRSLLAQMNVAPDAHDAVIQEIVSRQIIKRLGRAEEVADLIEFLLSEKASFITGSAASIDAGWSAW